MIKIEIGGNSYSIYEDSFGWYSNYTAIGKLPPNLLTFQHEILGYDDGGMGAFPYCKNMRDTIKLLEALLIYEEPYSFCIDANFRNRLSFCDTILLRKLSKAFNLPEGCKKDISYLVPSEKDPNMIKYIDKARFIKKVGSCNLWDNSFQYEQRIGKLLKSIFVKASASQIEESVNEWVAMNSPAEFMLVEGDDIARWYDGRRYSNLEKTGSLEGSCMRYDSCENYFRIYTDNPGRVSMIILVECGMLLGRALLWNTDQGDKFMDRIYGSDAVVSKFIRYAKDNKYIYKAYQSYDSKTEVYLPDDDYCSKVDLKMSVTLSSDFDEYPYIDTFSFGSEVRGSIGTLYNFNSTRVSRMYNCTGGGFYGDMSCDIDFVLDRETLVAHD